MLELKNVTKRFSRWEKPAVDSVSLQLRAGEVHGKVGLNGAGKTTTLRIACGLTLPESGRITVDEYDLVAAKVDASRRIGWVPEQPFHDSQLKIDALLVYYSDMIGGVESSTGIRLLREWGLWDHKKKRFRELSMGMRKRFAIVVASLLSPEYYLLDEPFNGLDPSAVAHLREWIRSSEGENRGVLLSSHNLREVRTTCDRVSVISHGRILATIPTSQIPPGTRNQVVVVLDRFAEDTIHLLREFGAVSVSGTTIKLRGESLDPGAINAKLVHAGYVVNELRASEDDLEEYLLRLVREDT
ncbi:MAG: ABC transporter ATP-binding protein [Thermoplasmata archaeon]|nr:ABC transporter ATP-binding protein [Thermoplasmata archaeon]